MPTTAIYVAAILLVLIVIFVIYSKYKRSANYRMATMLKPYRKDEIKNFIIPDGIGGLLEIEHLILLDQGLLLVEIYPMSGNLFGADEIDQWSQIIRGKSFKFVNPLRHIWISRQAIQALAPKTPVFCRIIFTADSAFPKGKPDEVSVLDSLAADLDVIKTAPIVTEKAQHSWDQIMRIARKNSEAVKHDEDTNE